MTGSDGSVRGAGRMGEVGAVLPQLIRDARSAVRAYEGSDRDRAAAYAVLAEAYQVAATTLTALGNPDAASTAMERATVAARRAGDPRLEAIGAATLAWVFTKQGRLEDAERVALAQADRIEPTFRSRPVDLSLWGILLLRAATALVRQGERRYDRVDELLRMATAAAAGIGTDRLDYATPFGPTNTAVAKVNFQVEMDRCAPALTTARAVPGLASLPPTWRARFHVDRALAHAGLDQDEAATHALLTAERDAPEWMRYHSTTRRLVADLHTRTPSHLPSDRTRRPAARGEVGRRVPPGHRYGTQRHWSGRWSPPAHAPFALMPVGVWWDAVRVPYARGRGG
ncbi:hypothetical protein ACQEU8_17430 [Streptomyces sp. CA-250714]|uniref:hypothetical protein n=1 Tax=Streptomyces sp. CA-250714 TaxID=3240060 RepID=UPI003D8E3BC2